MATPFRQMIIAYRLRLHFWSIFLDQSIKILQRHSKHWMSSWRWVSSHFNVCSKFIGSSTKEGFRRRGKRMATSPRQQTLDRRQEPSLSFRLHCYAYNSIYNQGLISKYRVLYFYHHTLSRIWYHNVSYWWRHCSQKWRNKVNELTRELSNLYSVCGQFCIGDVTALPDVWRKKSHEWINYRIIQSACGYNGQIFQNRLINRGWHRERLSRRSISNGAYFCTRSKTCTAANSDQERLGCWILS